MRRALLALVLVLAVVLPRAAEAQGRAERCRVQLVSSSDSGGYLGSSYFASGDVRLRCAGTEPFWGIEAGYGRADTNFAFDQRRRRVHCLEPVRRVSVLPALRAARQ